MGEKDKKQVKNQIEVPQLRFAQTCVLADTDKATANPIPPPPRPVIDAARLTHVKNRLTKAKENPAPQFLEASEPECDEPIVNEAETGVYAGGPVWAEEVILPLDRHVVQSIDYIYASAVHIGTHLVELAQICDSAAARVAQPHSHILDHFEHSLILLVASFV